MKTSAVVVFGSALCLSAACSLDTGHERMKSSSAAIYGGTTTDLTLEGAVQIACYDGFGGLCSVGSGSMVTNEWLISAAHVLVNPCGSVPVAKIIISELSGGAGPDYTQVYGQSESAALLARVHARDGYDPTGSPDLPQVGYDVAVVKLDQPLHILGTNTGFLRWPTEKYTSEFVYTGKKTFYGYSVLSQPSSWPPPASAFGNPASAQFDVVVWPPPGYNAAPTPLAFAVMRGGGYIATSNVNDIIPVPGDSGGPMVDPATGDLLGVLLSGNNATPIPHPEYATFTAAQAFRNWLRAKLATKAPGLLWDIDGDGIPDTVSLTRSALGTAQIAVVFTAAGITIGPWDTGIPLPLDAPAGFTPGDFNSDGYGDIVGHIDGQPLYFNGAPLSQFNFVNNIVQIGAAGWNIPSVSNNPVSFFDAGDYDHDGIDDVALVRADGSETIFLGKSSGLTQASYLRPRGFNFYGPGDQEAIVMSAPGVNPRLPGLPGGATPESGKVYLWSKQTSATGPSMDVLSLDVLASVGLPASAPGDEFGNTLAWGNFDNDPDRHELVIGATGMTIGAAKNAGMLVWLKVDATETASVAKIDRTFFGAAASEGDEFGAAIAAGDFDGDGTDDLAVGAPGAGVVHVAHGTADTKEPPLSADVSLTAPDFGLLNPSGLGRVLATGDFNCDGYEDLAMGLPSEDVGSEQEAGTVLIAYGGENGLELPPTSGGGKFQTIDKSLGIGGGTPKHFDHFGYVLAAGNFNGDANAGRPCIDLVVASEPFSLFGGFNSSGQLVLVQHAGAVDVVYGSPGGLSASGTQRLRQGAPAGSLTILDIAELGDRFGGSLAVTALNDDQYDDLVIGAWGEDGGEGVAQLLYGAADGITASGQAEWRQGASKILQPAQSGAHFGGHVGGTSNGVVLVAASDFDLSSPSAADAGWVAVVRVDDQASTIQQSEYFAATEASLTKGNAAVRTDAFLGRALIAARPAFVPVAAKARYVGSVNFSASGGSDGRLAVCGSTDTVAPVIKDIEVTPHCLWPANNKFVAFALGSNVKPTVLDCDPNPELRIVSIQSDEASASSATHGEKAFCLQAQRDGSGDGRVYTITIEARDHSGNSSTASFEVRVPHDQSAGDCPALSGSSFVSPKSSTCAFSGSD